ncbi:MAG: RagB/SusD family nutrient uptake outer membrane protein [Flavobacteriaceae bacterium]
MKINKLYIFILALSISLVSCSEDFLNDPKPTDEVSGEVVFGSLEGAEAFLSGIHRNMRSQFTSDDSAGLNSMYYARSVKGNDIIQGPTWFLFDYENDNREPNYRRTTFSWQYPYFMINQTNSLINGVETSEAISDADKGYLIGSAKAIRGLMYFQLALEFQGTYVGNESADAPPIYLETSLEGKPMSTMSELYAQIIDDLTYSVDNLSDYRLGKSYFNKAAAAGILTRVYQTTGNWDGVAEMANLAWGGGTVSAVLDPASYNAGFDQITNIEWIWGYEQSADQSNYYWGVPHSHADHQTLSYAGTFFNNDFYNLFSDTDVRKSTFVENYYNDNDVNSYRNIISTKFTFNFDSDNAFLRTAEMILAEAEGKYHLGMEADAHNLLFALQSNRDPNATKSTNTGDLLLQEILTERRKELYGEIGVEWFDAKRYGLGMPRTGNHRISGNADMLPNDKRYFLKVPQSEIDANDNIDDSVNANR